MSSPELVMIDEPSIGLAPIVVNDIFRIVEMLNREGYTILLSEQNAYKALKCAHAVTCSRPGRCRFPARPRSSCAILASERRTWGVDMEELIAQVINGLSLGSIYVLLATGFNLLLLVAMIIHFSYPQVVVLSMYVTWLVLQATGNNLVLGSRRPSLPPCCSTRSPLHLPEDHAEAREVDINTTMVVSMGIGMIITDVLSHSFNHGFPVAFPTEIVGEKPVFQLGLISVLPGTSPPSRSA